MKRIILSIIIITALGGYVAASTYASYSKSTKGSGSSTDCCGGCGSGCSAQLRIGNTAYYNGAYVPSLSWKPATSLKHKTFFAFDDVKPDDSGGNGITLRADKKDAWACMDLTLTQNDDNGNTEPELLVDSSDDASNAWDGELAQAIEMLWWADDGDHVFETGERVLGGGVQSLFNLASTSGPFVLPLADATVHAWGLPAGTPLRADTTYTLGTAWCMGTLTLAAVPQGSGGPYEGGTPRGQGVMCDGTFLGDITQTDTLGLTLRMRIEEAQRNESFTCVKRTTPVFIRGTCTNPTDTGVRYRSFKTRGADGAPEVYLGADIDMRTRRVTQDLAWAHGTPQNVTFTYDKASDTFTSTVEGHPTLTYPKASRGASCPVAKWNLLEVGLRGGNKGTVSLGNIRVNGTAYGTLSSTRPYDYWTLSGLNLSDSFTVTGAITFTESAANNGEGTSVEIVVGCTKL